MLRCMLIFYTVVFAVSHLIDIIHFRCIERHNNLLRFSFRGNIIIIFSALIRALRLVINHKRADK